MQWEREDVMPKGREHKPQHPVSGPRDAAVTPAAPDVEVNQERLDAATRHAALCRLLARGFDRVELALQGATEEALVDQVALAAIPAAAYIVAPQSPAAAVARLAWGIADAWMDERERHAARAADAAKRKEAGR